MTGRRHHALLRSFSKGNTVKKCLHPECETAPESRGLCKKHYMQAIRAVLAGAATWDELVMKGKAHPIKRTWFRT